MEFIDIGPYGEVDRTSKTGNYIRYMPEQPYVGYVHVVAVDCFKDEQLQEYTDAMPAYTLVALAELKFEKPELAEGRQFMSLIFRHKTIKCPPAPFAPIPPELGPFPKICRQ